MYIDPSYIFLKELATLSTENFHGSESLEASLSVPGVCLPGDMQCYWPSSERGLGICATTQTKHLRTARNLDANPHKLGNGCPRWLDPLLTRSFISYRIHVYFYLQYDTCNASNWFFLSMIFSVPMLFILLSLHAIICMQCIQLIFLSYCCCSPCYLSIFNF